ncbi:endo-1,4-beta-xylanase [Sorangium sp. So ce1153]|uniref:endo-1,4-beta-xylanase n=1 Tax=Sorangium sp. So ce1153 TaxID=3133333 RepID=UPI003F62BC7C
MRFERWPLLTVLALSACISAEQADEDGYELDESAESVTIDTAATYTLVGVQSGKCVDVAGGSTADAAAMQIATCNGSTRQQFRMESAGGGYYRIRNVNSNRCLDVAGASTSDGAAVQQYSCWTGENQQWSFTDVATGVVRLTARNSGKSLDVYARGTADGTALVQWASNGGTNQQFRLTPVTSGGTGAGGGGGTGGGGTGGGGTGGGGTGGGTTGKFVGNITTGGTVRSDLARYWNQLSPENEGKWGSVEPTRDVMNWAGMDRVRNYARENGIPYKGHTLVWGAQQPGWIGGLSQSEQRAEVEEWIQAFCQRYPDVAIIDVVNEPPPHTTPAYMNALGGAGSSGYDWIVQAFKWARQYCPNAKLLLNDYNNIEYSGDNQNTINIVNRIRAAGAPIDGIGAQAHAAFSMPTSTVKGFLDRLAATGLPVYITEYDIALANDTQQLNVMQSQFPMFYEHPSVRGVTLWGYITGQTWVANTGLMSSSGQMRPAMSWLMNYLGR